MLPSTGYFKTINCPFYESGTCDRPYCHFKHARREDAAVIETATGTPETRTTGQAQESKASDSDVLQRLVTEAVKKVLGGQEGPDTEKLSDDVVSKVVEGLGPKISDKSELVKPVPTNPVGKHLDMPVTISKPVTCVYNPTPIAELKKRHIPIVSYMPTRDSRPTAKRKSSPDRIKPWLGIVNESSESHSTEVTYKPTAIVNTNEQSYVPTCKSETSSLTGYEDGNSNDSQTKIKEAYYPKSKKRREEYVPKKVKAPLTNIGQVESTTLEEFSPKFDIMNEIFTGNLKNVHVTPSEDSQGSCVDMEPKFSDDEESLGDILGLTVKESEGTSANYSGTIYNKETVTVKASSSSSSITTTTKEEAKESESYSKKLSKSTEERRNSNLSTSAELDIKSDSKENERKKSREEHKKDHRKTERSRSKDRKSRSSSSHSSSKHKHKHESNADRKHHSSSRSSDKSRSHSHASHSSSKNSSSRKEKHSGSQKDKDSHRKTDKHHKHESSSDSKSKKSERSSEKSHEKRHSSSSHKSSKHSSKKSKTREDNREEKSLSDSSTSGPDNFKFPVEMGNDENGIGYEDDEIFSISDSDHDVQEECLKIFQEYEVTEHPKPVCIKETVKHEEESNEELGRKRIAHPSAAGNVSRQISVGQPLKKLVTPQQKMYERWRLMRDAAAEKTVAEVKPPQVNTTCNNARTMETVASRSAELQQLNGNGRVRIAHVPYARSLAMEKKKVVETTTAKAAENKAAESRTAAQTAKSGVRVAHIPQAVPQLVRPEPLQVATPKFPLNVRQYYVNIMHDVCIQIYTNSEDAGQRAVKEELACHEKCKALPVYKNSCMLAAHRLRKEIDQAPTSDGPAASSSGMVSHESVLAGKSKGSWSVLKTKKLVTDVKGAALYNMLKKWILTDQQLKDNGFPRPHPDGQKGHAKVYVTNTRGKSILSKVPNERICCRCGQAYAVDKQGQALQQQNCIYHWGRKFTIRGEGKYSCCQQYGSASGCCDAKTHVWDYTDYENLRGYVKTLPKEIPVEEQGVYALDCEMCYTTQGLELTRVTVIDEDCNVVYETLVQPQNPITDFNTRFSGITEEDMKSVTTTLLDVQATLLTMFSDKTVLVGHSLESDFKALKLLHDTVVDTSVMFPHKNGYPQKRALKNLCSEYLRKIIQNDVGGHDSKEDAVSCMELIIWKVKEEAKLL